ncbi:fructosamine kinase family protein [Neptuniibacter sp. QD29_5]|uniref:fructosamine kinase family protein n=1 Tax=Neptuniibacter sp. QD29_5 TaxID=3398207 RepID=UPI0039F531EE
MKSLQSWVEQQGLSIDSEESLSGGCIAAAKRVLLSDGQQLFVKSVSHANERMFKAEAAGLQALSACAELSTPKVIQFDRDGLILEFIEQSPKDADFDQVLGRQLAHLHQMPVPSFGFTENTFCGPTEQPNSQLIDGFEFYAEHRFGYLARLCYDRGLIDKEINKGIESINKRLKQLVPEQNPALLHGDLWAGNVIANSQGKPVLIDPAVYWGWTEADLAMTDLFGGFSSDLYSAYREVAPLYSGWKERFPLYNLWHLLNHLLLFGGSYRADVMGVVAKFR